MNNKIVLHVTFEASQCYFYLNQEINPASQVIYYTAQYIELFYMEYQLFK